MLNLEVEEEVLKWIRDSYVPCAERCGASSGAMLARVLDANPGGAAYAVHMSFPCASDAADWNEGAGETMRTILFRRYGDKALTFTSYLEPLE